MEETCSEWIFFYLVYLNSTWYCNRRYGLLAVLVEFLWPVLCRIAEWYFWLWFWKIYNSASSETYSTLPFCFAEFHKLDLYYYIPLFSYKLWKGRFKHRLCFERSVCILFIHLAVAMVSYCQYNSVYNIMSYFLKIICCRAWVGSHELVCMHIR